MNFIINFLFRRLTVDSIVASFDKTIANLDLVKQKQLKKRDKHTEAIERADGKRLQAEAEAMRAHETAERFKRLVRGEESKDDSKCVAVSDIDGVRFGKTTVRTDGAGRIAGFGIDSDSLRGSAA